MKVSLSPRAHIPNRICFLDPFSHSTPSCLLHHTIPAGKSWRCLSRATATRSSGFPPPTLPLPRHHVSVRWVCRYHGLTAHARHRLPSVFYACGSIDARLHANPSEPCLRVRVLSAANPSCWLMSGRTSARSTLSTVHLTCLDESRRYGTSDIRPHYNLARRTIAHKCSVPCRLRTHFAYTEEPCRALSAVLCE